ncbi:MAG: type II secretion system protein GspG [Candidatus Omnitrophica bacterium]|nr:type II secretion system protein GspG [Candidatus Omnitrophota bacterium]
MTVKKTPNVLCPACGKGRLEYRARPGRTYEYKKESQHKQDYDLSSLGSDGQPGKDDVTNWD